MGDGEVSNECAWDGYWVIASDEARVEAAAFGAVGVLWGGVCRCGRGVAGERLLDRVSDGSVWRRCWAEGWVCVCHVHDAGVAAADGGFGCEREHEVGVGDARLAASHADGVVAVVGECAGAGWICVAALAVHRVCGWWWGCGSVRARADPIAGVMVLGKSGVRVRWLNERLVFRFFEDV